MYTYYDLKEPLLHNNQPDIQFSFDNNMQETPLTLSQYLPQYQPTGVSTLPQLQYQSPAAVVLYNEVLTTQTNDDPFVLVNPTVSAGTVNYEDSVSLSGYTALPTGYNTSPNPIVTTGIDNPYPQIYPQASSNNSQPNSNQNVNIGVQQQNQTMPDSFPVNIIYGSGFPKVIYKNQKRVKGEKSKQRVENGEVEFILDFQNIVTRKNVQMIEVFVKRTNGVPNTHRYVGPVRLEPKFQPVEGSKFSVKVDLDSVFEVNGKKVYELQKTLTEDLNTFHLIVNVTLQDGCKTTVNTKEFLMVGKKNGKRPHAAPGREHANSTSSAESQEPPTKIASPGSSGYYSPFEDEDIIQARTIVAEHVQTETMDIAGILISDKIQSPHGDIAYHFRLDKDGEVFEEGEIVALVMDEHSNKQNIAKITLENACDAKLKGVITRSQYFEAQKPPPGVRSETICMMGIVPVKVQGSVEANEALYASSDVPGVAVSGFYLTTDQRQEWALIGYAFQSHKVNNETEIGTVNAGISVLHSASQVLLNKRFREMEQHWGLQIKKIKRESKKGRKCAVCCCVSSLIFVLLLSIFLWQLLVPGTAYRYYICRRGSIPGHTATFKFIPGPNVFNVSKCDSK